MSVPLPSGQRVAPGTGDALPRWTSDLDRVPVLVVHALDDSGPGHWQSRWLKAHRRFRRVVQPDFATPELNRWAATVAIAIDGCEVPPLIVAHSYGCLAAIRAGHLFERPIAGALLVAPADPDRFGAMKQLPSRALPYPSIVVASNDDPWIKLTKAGLLASRWGGELVALPGAGHINVDSGHGPWPAGFRLLRRLAARIVSGSQRVLPAAGDDRVGAWPQTAGFAPLPRRASGAVVTR